MNEEGKRQVIERHLDLVIKANETTNITRIKSKAEAEILHIEDSLVGLEEMSHCPEGLYGDMGSGAGYPGIPIAVYTERPTILIDSVGKKTKILDSFIDELGLSHVKTFNGRLEELAQNKPEAFSALTARAVSKLGALMELASPLLTKEGCLICYKAHVNQEEFEHALLLQKKLGMKLLSDRELFLSDGVTYRRILVFQKYKRPEIKLPRKIGMAQKKPL